MPSTRAVFFDRDGVLNRAAVRGGLPYSPQAESELEIVPEARAALESLAALGYLLIVATNQPDVARGKQTREAVEALNVQLRRALPLDDVYVCFHDDADACECRKPKPGMLLQAAARYDIDLAASFMVGDRWRDIEAGRRAGARTIFIDHGYREPKPDPPADATVSDLAQAADWIVSGKSPPA